MLLPLLLACTAADPGPEGPGETYAGVITRLNFGRREGLEGWGFDLDGHVTEAGDDAGCGQADLVDPEGLEGIDSAFSSLVPALEATEASAVEDLIQDSIRNGELVLAVELSGVHDLDFDDCVDLRLARSTTAPMLGTDGELLDDQTFEVDSARSPAALECVALEDGTVLAGPFALDLALRVLDVELEFHLTQGRVRANLTEEGLGWGYFAGAVPLSDILAIVAEDDLADIRDLVTSLVQLAADMQPDESGACQALSIVFEYEPTPAFLYDGG